MTEIPMVNQKGTAAWVDDHDSLLFGRLPWKIDKKGRPYRSGAQFVGDPGKILLVDLMFGINSGQKVVHRNHLALDCRRENLEVVRHPNPGRSGSCRINTNAIMLRFLRAFPKHDPHRGYHFYTLTALRRILEIIRSEALLTAEEFLGRIDGWAIARAYIQPWDLKEPAPLMYVAPAIEVQPVALPEVNTTTGAVVGSILRPYVGDGTE